LKQCCFGEFVFEHIEHSRKKRRTSYSWKRL